jgi:hypothetical protein
MRRQLVVLVAVLACWASAVGAEELGEGGVGITTEPDSLRVVSCIDGCPSFWPSQDSGFTRFEMEVHYPDVDLDIDLLIQDAFQEYPQLA